MREITPEASTVCDVVVLMPVFNAQKHCDETLHSLKTSTLACDVLVVDDGSEPPLEITSPGPQVTVTVLRLQKNQGIVGALNAGLETAILRGYKFIARIDAGDLVARERLAKQRAYLEQYPSCMLVGCDALVQDEKEQRRLIVAAPRDPKQLAAALHERPWILHPSVMYNATVFGKVGLYTSQYEAAEDYEMFLRIAQRHEVGTVPEPLLTYIVRSGGISKKKERTQTISRLRIQIRYFAWRELLSYYGVCRTLSLLMLPLWLKGVLKRLFLGVSYGNPVVERQSELTDSGESDMRQAL